MIADFRMAWGFMTRNLVKPPRYCNYGRRTLAGAYNRWLRDRGQGEPMWRLVDRQWLFEGFDAQDYYEFRLMLREKLPFVFTYSDVWETEIDEWIDQNTTGEYRHTFNPMFVEGHVLFADTNDAFFFKVFKAESKIARDTDRRRFGGRTIVEVKPEEIMPVSTVSGKFVERFCLRTYFSVVAYVKSWFGGRDEPVRSR